jgi:hypothetical protein
MVNRLIISGKKQNDKERNKCTHKSKHVRKVASEWRLYSLSKETKVSTHDASIDVAMDSINIINNFSDD